MATSEREGESDRRIPYDDARDVVARLLEPAAATLGAPVESAAVYDAAVATVVRIAVGLAGARRGLLPALGRPDPRRPAAWRAMAMVFEDSFGGLRLFDAARYPFLELEDDAGARVIAALADREVPGAGAQVEEIGRLYEAVLGHGIRCDRSGRLRLVRGRGRRRTGSFFTPTALAERIVRSTIGHMLDGACGDPDRVLDLRVCDPAMGAGAFLLEAARQLSVALDPTGRDSAARRTVVERCLFGVDVSDLAVAVAEASLWLFVGDVRFRAPDLRARLLQGDSLLGAAPGDLELWFGRRAARGSRARVAADIVTGASLGAAGRSERSRARRSALEDGREILAGRRDPDGDPRVAAARAAGALHWEVELARVFEGGGFHAVVGNPPWVAFAGRAAQPLDPAWRAHYAESYRAFRGYPTLHGMFVERATRLAPEGVIGLVIPSPVADLDGYRPVRRVLTEHHEVREPLHEFGQDAFETVLQPSFALVADPVSDRESTDAPWRLEERQRSAGIATTIRVPELLRILAAAQPLPPETFREMGFQSAGRVAKELLRRGVSDGDYPLLEGRDVTEFRVGPPRMCLDLDRERLMEARCRVRARSDYEGVRFVLRQTASYPIAAKHTGLPFRNSLLAGFEAHDLSTFQLVGILNSALYRALHLASTRDARQATFPQMKLKHLRSLPRPPNSPRELLRVEQASARATRDGINPELRRELDRAVFDLFGVPEDHREATLTFLAARAPRLGYGPRPTATPVASLDPVRKRLRLGVCSDADRAPRPGVTSRRG